MNKNIVRLADVGLRYEPDMTRNGARLMMMRMIEDTPGLKESLENAGYNIGRKLTPKHVEIIYDYIGKPE